MSEINLSTIIKMIITFPIIKLIIQKIIFKKDIFCIGTFSCLR